MRISRPLLALLAAAALVTAAPAARPAAAKDKLTIATSNLVGFLYVPTLVAKELGYFDDEGIEVEVVGTGGGSKALAALVGGNAQIYVGAPTSAFRARSKGADVVVIAANMRQFATNFIISGDWAKRHALTPASSYADKLKAMKGMVVAISSPGSGSDTLVRAIANEAGLDANRDVTITAVGNGEAMTAALIQGRVDGFTHSSPVGENVIKNHGGMMFLNTSRGEVKSLDGFFYIAQIATESWLKENEALAVRYLRAIQKALDAIHDPALTNKARDATHAEYNSKLDKDLYDSIWEATLPAYTKSIDITKPMIETVVDFANKYEKTPIDRDTAASGWTDRYAKAALGAAGAKQ